VAALDARIIPWVGPLIADGDTLRRKAQDHLFAGDRATLEQAGEWLERAQASYDGAWNEAVPCAEAFDSSGRSRMRCPIMVSGSSAAVRAAVPSRMSSSRPPNWLTAPTRTRCGRRGTTPGGSGWSTPPGN